MASNSSDTAKDLDSRPVSLGDMAREAQRRAFHAGRVLRTDYRRLTGTTPARKPDPRKYPKARSGGGR